MIKEKQYTFLSFYLTRSLFFGGAISLLVKIGKNNLLITSILGMLLGYFLLYLFYKKDSINKISICLVSFLVIFITALCNTLLTSNFLLYETPSVVVLLLFFIPTIYIVNKDFNSTPRISQMYFPISIIVLLFSFIALSYLVHLNNLLPLFNTNIIDFIKGIVIFAISSVLPNLLLINYKGDLEFKKVSRGYIIGCISIIIMMFYILSIYGYEFASIVRFPEYLMLKKIDIFNYVSNVENIFILEWLSSLVISTLFCVKVLFDNTNKITFIGLLIIMFMFLYYAATGNYIIINYIKIYYYTYVILGALLFSLLTWKKV